MHALDWACNKAVNGLSGLDSAEDLVLDYMKEEGSLTEQVNSLIR